MGSVTPLGPQPPYFLHPSIQEKLDPVYAAFYNKHIFDKQQVHLQPVAASRTSGVLIPGAGPKLPVGKVEDLKIKRRETDGPDVPIRVFTPEGERSSEGWPVMMYFHGGGWVLGNIDTENVVCTNLCNRAKCVVITVDYRLAPENPYPAAVHDSWESLLWLQTTGFSLLHLNPAKCAIGGSSAGGNLAAIMCHKAVSAPASVPRFLVQLLIVPVTDNTAETSSTLSWKENEFTPALPAKKMMWYRWHYLPNENTWGEPEASPLLYEDGWEKQPKALVVVGELDVLRTEGEQYAEKLRNARVEADLKIFKGMPHPFLAMDGALQQGRDTITAMVEKLKESFA
ncbi:probable arylacetamide deacetylase [Phialocephala subalpina]|uniref:Probable arylacetamide deacetylase n=1 Tax=Phialocephala subalpina TaxID=576137 RepID=A0A1L7WHL6_9HELO|nr:probable arylacetamide deacetylase [Phialocephala subalpina]